MNAEPPELPDGSGHASRSAARLHAVQALYQMDQSGAAAEAVIIEFTRHRLGHEIDGEHLLEPDRTLFADIVSGAVERQADIDARLSDALTERRPLERLELIMRAILRAAAYELLVRLDVPARVIVNEYVDIAHAFFSGPEPGFVNGVLDAVGRLERSGEMKV
jgi:N utilization substance protein B